MDILPNKLKFHCELNKHEIGNGKILHEGRTYLTQTLILLFYQVPMPCMLAETEYKKDTFCNCDSFILVN